MVHYQRALSLDRVAGSARLFRELVCITPRGQQHIETDKA